MGVLARQEIEMRTVMHADIYKASVPIECMASRLLKTSALVDKS